MTCSVGIFFSLAWYKLELLGAAAAAKSLQSCPTLCNPIDSSPPGSPVPGILQARILEWVAISFSNAWKWKVKVKSLSLVQLLGAPWTKAHQAPPSMGFSRQESWSGVPLPSPRASWWLKTSARMWCTRKTQRNRVEREVGEGIRMGNTCKSMANSCQYMTKTTTIL